MLLPICSNEPLWYQVHRCSKQEQITSQTMTPVCITQDSNWHWKSETHVEIHRTMWGKFSSQICTFCSVNHSITEAALHLQYTHTYVHTWTGFKLPSKLVFSAGPSQRYISTASPFAASLTFLSLCSSWAGMVFISCFTSITLAPNSRTATVRSSRQAATILGCLFVRPPWTSSYVWRV